MALTAAAVGLASCATVSRVGSPTDPSVASVLDAVEIQPRTFAVVKDPPPPLSPLTGAYRVVGHEPAWLLLADQGGTARVPQAQLQSISTFDRLRGAGDGAVIGGLIGLPLGLGVAFLARGQGTVTESDSIEGSPRGPSSTMLKYGLISAVALGAVGALLGAIAGHEDRIEVLPGPPLTTP